MGFKVKNLASPLFILKVFEVMLAIIVVCLYACGPYQYIGNEQTPDIGNGIVHTKLVGVWGNNTDKMDLGIFTCIAYLLITSILMVGMIMGDKAKISLILFNLVGLFCYIICGSYAIQSNTSATLPKNINYHQGLAMGSLAIIQGCILFVDTLLSILELWKGHKEENV